MKRLKQTLSNFAMRNKQYFSTCQDIITTDNKVALFYFTRVFFIILFLFCVITLFLLPNSLLTVTYLIFLILDGIFLILAERFNRQKDTSFASTQKICLLFTFLPLAFTICISVFPFPERPGIFYPIAYILVATLFAFPYRLIMLVLNAASIVYLILVAIFKSPTAASYDYFSCISASLLSYFVVYVLTRMRLRNGEILNHLRQMKRTDNLTGLLNRNGANQVMPRTFRRCQMQKRAVTMMMLDVDNFKIYNDTLGHPAGDRCLQALGELLLAYANDLGILAIRYGGEEFLLFLPDCSNEDAKIYADSLLERVRKLAYPGPNGPVTISVGVAVQTADDNLSLDALIEQADSMLYESKRNGKNRATFINLDES